MSDCEESATYGPGDCEMTTIQPAPPADTVPPLQATGMDLTGTIPLIAALVVFGIIAVVVAKREERRADREAVTRGDLDW